MKTQKIRSFLGYLTAVLMIPLSLATFIGMGPLAELLVNSTGVVISPWFTGGEVSQTIPHAGYETRIYRPVFDGLLFERRNGFVQVVWGPAQELPETIIEDIDYDQDGSADFQIELHPQAKTATGKTSNDYVGQLEGPYAIGDGIGIRMTLKNH